MKKFSLSIAAFAFLLVLPVAASAATIRINTPKIELELSPGETYSGEILCENPADEELKMKMYLEDWTYKPSGTGEKDFTPAGSTAFSAAKWITFSPASETLKPFGRTVLRYNVVVPQDVKGSYYSVLFFETLLGTVTNEEGANVLVAGRVGALFLIRIKGTIEHSGKVESVELVPPKGNSPLEIQTVFKNTGNVDIALGGNFLLMDVAGKIVARGDIQKIYTQPGGGGQSVTKWVGRLSSGQYNAVITYDLGKGQTDVQEKTLTVE